MLRSASKISALVLSFVMLVSLFVPFTVKAEGEQVNITILGTSDLHGRIYPYEYAIDSEDQASGFAKVATVVKKVRGENPNTIVVDCGDTIQDNMAELFNNDPVHPMVRAMNEIGFDTWTLGNHEFNFGLDLTNRSIKGFNGTVLAGNIYKEDGSRFVEGYKIIEKGGVKIGLIGMITPHVPRWEASTPDNFKGLSFKDPLEETKKVVAEIKDQVDVMVGIMHMGPDFEYGFESAGLKAIANAVPELTAIIGGHQHLDLKGELINGVLVVEPAAYGKKVSRIDLSFENKGGKWVLSNKKSENIDTKPLEADKDMLAKFKPEHDKAIAEVNTVIGKLSDNFLDKVQVATGIPTAQVKDTALVDFINEVQLYYTGADVSSAALFDNRSNLVKGDFKKKDVANIYKYTNTLMAVKVNGKQLKDYMEWSAKYYNQFKPEDGVISFDSKIPGYNYDMFAGVNYEVDVTAPVGIRIKNLTFKGQAVTDDMTFKLAVNNYRFGNMVKDGYFKAEDEIYDSYKLMGDKGRIRDLIVEYVQKKGTITPKVDNNWKVTGVSLDYKTVDVLSINDFHGSLVSSGKNIGIANLVGEIKKAKTANPNTLFVGAGDLFQGSAESNLLYGKPVAETLKEAGMVATAIGNHEYDWGIDKIDSWKKDGGFEFLAANVYDKATNAPVNYAKPYIISEVDGVKVAFIGIATPETEYKTKPENVKNVIFKNPAEILPKYITEVKDKGANIVIALTHLGAMQDKDGVITGEAADIAKVPGLDGIICGHSHQTIKGTVNKVAVVQGYYNGRSLAKLSYILDKNTNKVLKVVPSIDELYNRAATLTADAATKAILDKYMAQVSPILSEKLGVANVDLNHDSKGPSLMGEWVCDIMKAKSGAQIAIQNGGGLRISIPKGELTVGKMYELMPFDNTLVTAKLTGAQVKEAIEHGIGNEKISFGQMSGVYASYDMSRPFGDRIVSLTLENGQPLDMNAYYTVVANDFMFDGGDNYNVLKQGKEKKDTGVPIREAIIEYVKQQKVIDPAFKGYQKVGQAQVQTQVQIQEVVYIVQPGDCLWKIAKKYGIPYQEIGVYNKLKNMDLIFPSQELKIPAKK